jgi:hypothetical protein
MGKNTKIFLNVCITIVLLGAIFWGINHLFGLFKVTKISKMIRGGTNCFIIAMIMMKFFKDHSRKKIDKVYKESIPFLMLFLFFAAVSAGSLVGKPHINLICGAVGLIIGGMIFFKKKRPTPTFVEYD